MEQTIFQSFDRADRVREHSALQTNTAIDLDIEKRLKWYSTRTPEEITRRIEELELEWDVERALEATAAIVAGASLYLSVSKNSKWLLLAAVNQLFLLTHAAGGWCPPISVLRRLHLRTRREIDAEKYALKTLRGDFLEIETVPDRDSLQTAGKLLQAVRK